MIQGVTTLSIARLRALTPLKRDLAQRILDLQNRGLGWCKESQTLRQSLNDVKAEVAGLETTIAAARASL